MQKFEKNMRTVNEIELTLENDEAWVMARRNRYHGMEPIKNTLKAVGNPEEHLKIIHITGTNGKGSTTCFLKDILKAHGFSVGMFTSPHLADHRDRIRINDAWIPHDVFHTYLCNDLSLILQYDLGMFEIDELIALQWFYERNVDYVLMEAGLGGRKDNTNVIQHPLLELITTVSFDHMNVLGERIQQIAFEKAGILKHNSCGVYGYLNPDAECIVKKHAQRVGCAVHKVNPFRDTGKNTFTYRNVSYSLSTAAQYQKRNAALALEAAWMLSVPIQDPQTVRAVRESKWPGRFEMMHESPNVILDGAHNTEGMTALISSLKDHNGKLITVFSALKDKPFQQMAAMLEEASDTLFITHFDNERSGDFKHLLIQNAEYIEDYSLAISKAIKQAAPEDTVLITGSLYFISLARAYLLSKA